MSGFSLDNFADSAPSLRGLRSLGAELLRLEHSTTRQNALEHGAYAMVGRWGKGAAAILPSLAIGWAECGFPTVEPSHRLAASFMATRVSEDAATSIAMPWRCFAVLAPSGLCRADWMIVVRSRDSDRVKLLTHYTNGDVSFGDEPSLAAWSDVSFVDAPDEAVNFEVQTKLVGRLLLGVCLELSTAPITRKPSTNKHIGKHRSGEPSSWTFRLSRNVNVNCVDAIRGWANGTGSQLTLQSLVRGHWKMQPFGPGRSERKAIHVEPYWRGPEDAPIAVRNHRLKGAA